MSRFPPPPRRKAVNRKRDAWADNALHALVRASASTWSWLLIRAATVAVIVGLWTIGFRIAAQAEWTKALLFGLAPAILTLMMASFFLNHLDFELLRAQARKARH